MSRISNLQTENYELVEQNENYEDNDDDDDDDDDNENKEIENESYQNHTSDKREQEEFAEEKDYDLFSKASSHSEDSENFFFKKERDENKFSKKPSVERIPEKGEGFHLREKKSRKERQATPRSSAVPQNDRCYLRKFIERKAMPCSNRRLFPSKVPGMLDISSYPYSQQSECDKDRLYKNMVKWTQKTDPETGELLSDQYGNIQLDTNSWLIQWSDGSWTLYVGDLQYDCQFHPDKAFLLEESKEDTLISHGMTEEKITLRPVGDAIVSNVLGKSGIQTPRGKTTQLTSPAESFRAQIINKRNLESIKNINVSKIKKHVASQVRKAQDTALFLENDEEEFSSSSQVRYQNPSHGTK